MLIVGGVISGDCSTGRKYIEPRPHSAIMIESTEANTGRSMKNLEIMRASYSVSALSGASVPGIGFTTIPGCTLSSPSTTTRSPGESPS